MRENEDTNIVIAGGVVGRCYDSAQDECGEDAGELEHDQNRGADELNRGPRAILIPS